jgi:hypothetical protein
MRAGAGLAVVALLAAVAVGAVAASRGDDARTLATVAVDERNGVLHGVRFGDGLDAVRSRRGPPTDDAQGFFPEGSDFTGPPSIPNPHSDSHVRPTPLHYGASAYLVSPSVGVYAMANARGRRTHTIRRRHRRRPRTRRGEVFARSVRRVRGGGVAVRGRSTDVSMVSGDRRRHRRLLRRGSDREHHADPSLATVTAGGWCSPVHVDVARRLRRPRPARMNDPPVVSERQAARRRPAVGACRGPAAERARVVQPRPRSARPRHAPRRSRPRH